MLGALLLAGLAEGLSLSTLLPLLSIATQDPTAGNESLEVDGFGGVVTRALLSLGVTPSIGVLIVVIVCGITIKSGLVLLAKKRVGYTVAQFTTDMRLNLLRKLLETRWEYYLHQPLGVLANTMSTEPMRAGSAYLDGVMVIALLIQCIVYTAVAFSISWEATLACLVVGGALFYPLRYLLKMARRAGRRRTKLLNSLLAMLIDSFQSVKLLKAMAREELADTVLVAETNHLNRALQREVFSKEALRAAQEPLFTIVIASGLYVALVHWNLPFATVLVLTVLLARLLDRLGKVQKDYQRFLINESAYWSYQGTIRRAERERETTTGTVTPTLSRDIRLDQVSFSYADRPVLQDCSLVVPAGSMTALVGPSGAGKTTIVDLVTGLLTPKAGQILIDGRPLTEIHLKRWRRLIGYVPQEHLLLHDTILINVTLGDTDLAEDDAERALRAAGAWRFVSELPTGVHSTVGERGAMLSGGQRQRIMIARALAHDPKLLILDEATTALDPETEAGICATLKTLSGRLTIMAISHQRALVDAADTVYRLRDGTVTLVTDGSTLPLDDDDTDATAHIA